MNRYQKGKIYKLVNDADDEIYVGSSCLDLPKRFYSHKHAAKLKGYMKVYNHLNTIGWGNVHIILIESFSCSNKMELEKRERYWIDTLSPSLNSSVPARTDIERATYQANYKIERSYKCDICNCLVPLISKLFHEQSNIHHYNMKKEATRAKLLAGGEDIKFYLCQVCDLVISKSSKWDHTMSVKHETNVKKKSIEKN